MVRVVIIVMPAKTQALTKALISELLASGNLVCRLSTCRLPRNRA